MYPTIVIAVLYADTKAVDRICKDGRRYSVPRNI